MFKPQRLILIVLMFFMASSCTYANEKVIVPEEPLLAYFAGYEEDDIIFHLVNNLQEEVEVKGLSFRQQILYRPVEKTILPAASDMEEEFIKVLFRTTGDFLWSENHMESFRLTFKPKSSEERQYVKIYRQLPKDDQ